MVDDALDRGVVGEDAEDEGAVHEDAGECRRDELDVDVVGDLAARLGAPVDALADLELEIAEELALLEDLVARVSPAVITEPSAPVAALLRPWFPQYVESRSERSDPVSWSVTCGADFARTSASTTRLAFVSHRR